MKRRYQIPVSVSVTTKRPHKLTTQLNRKITPHTIGGSVIPLENLKEISKRTLRRFPSQTASVTRTRREYAYVHQSLRTSPSQFTSRTYTSGKIFKALQLQQFERNLFSLHQLKPTPNSSGHNLRKPPYSPARIGNNSQDSHIHARNLNQRNTGYKNRTSAIRLQTRKDRVTEISLQRISTAKQARRVYIRDCKELIRHCASVTHTSYIAKFACLATSDILTKFVMRKEMHTR